MMKLKRDNRLYLVSASYGCGKKRIIAHALIAAPSARRAAGHLEQGVRLELSRDDWQHAHSEVSRVSVDDLDSILACVGLRVVERR